MNDEQKGKDKFTQKEDDPAINDRIQEAIRTVINQQLAEKDPPEALETFERLLEEGFSNEEAYNLIGHLVSLEVGEMLHGGAINLPRYRASLEELPAPFSKPRISHDDEEEE